VVLLTSVIRWTLARRAADDSLLVRRRRGDALVDFTELVMNGRLSFRMFAVHPSDHVVCRFRTVKVGVVAVTEQELAARRRMRSHSPTSWLVTVIFLYKLIDARSDGAKDAELGEVRTES
jgi:hypothetical protein